MNLAASSLGSHNSQVNIESCPMRLSLDLEIPGYFSLARLAPCNSYRSGLSKNRQKINFWDTPRQVDINILESTHPNLSSNDESIASEAPSDLSEWESEDGASTLQRPNFTSKEAEAEWERKQRNREYRVAARREKRLRKADEKKQRKLNAMILRRMTKNPEKYNKNVDRNRMREIELERRKIWKEAVSQAERLAAIHDPSGRMFNVGPVVVQENGQVVSLEVLERRKQLAAERAAKEAQTTADAQTANDAPAEATGQALEGINPERRQLIQPNGTVERKMSKNQQKKLAALEPRPPPPRPVIPEGIPLPEGEENWVARWDLADEELERRVLREKKRKAAERKALRLKQQEGKTERRAARDERRRVYREKKLEWKAIKEEEAKQKKALLRVEQEEAKKVEIEVNIAEPKR